MAGETCGEFPEGVATGTVNTSQPKAVRLKPISTENSWEKIPENHQPGSMDGAFCGEISCTAGGLCPNFLGGDATDTVYERKMSPEIDLIGI